MIRNPFRDALVTYDLLPDPLRPKLIPCLFDDWRDLESNANPIEHTPAPSTQWALDYLNEWGNYDDMEDEPYPELHRQWLERMGDAWDRLSPMFPDDDTSEWMGEKVSLGQYLDVRDSDWPLWPEFASGTYEVYWRFDNDARSYYVRFQNHEIVEAGLDTP